MPGQPESEALCSKKSLSVYDGSQRRQGCAPARAVLAKGFNADLCALWVRELLPRHSDLPGEFEAEAESGGRILQGTFAGKSKRWATEHGIPIRLRNAPRPCGQNILRFADGRQLRPDCHRPQRTTRAWGRLLGDTGDRISDHAIAAWLIVKPDSTVKVRTAPL